MEIFDFLVMAVVVGGVVKIISRWLTTKDRVKIQELEQRLHVLEAQQLLELQKRLSVLEEIFVTDDVA